MTVSASINREMTVGTVWQRAYQVAGLYEASQSIRDADKSLAKDLSEGIIDQLPLYGAVSRQKTFDTITCTSGTYRYDMATTTADVIGNGQYIAASVSDITKASGETLVEQVDIETWHRISGKNATGRPNIFFTNRVATTVAAWLWPIPTEAGRIRFLVQRHLADMNNENSTMDLETYWTDYVIWALAAQLAEAKSIPGSKVDRLKQEARVMLVKARSFSNPHTPNQMYYAHRVQ